MTANNAARATAPTAWTPPARRHGPEPAPARPAVRDFAERFSAERFHTLSESIDLQDARPEDGTAPAVFAGVCQDLLVPSAQMEKLARRWAGPARLILFDSVFGHDAFLKDDDAIAAVLGDLRGACHD